MTSSQNRLLKGRFAWPGSMIRSEWGSPPTCARGSTGPPAGWLTMRRCVGRKRVRFMAHGLRVWPAIPLSVCQRKAKSGIFARAIGMAPASRNRLTGVDGDAAVPHICDGTRNEPPSSLTRPSAVSCKQPERRPHLSEEPPGVDCSGHVWTAPLRQVLI
jgi:hypothetical protein